MFENFSLLRNDSSITSGNEIIILSMVKQYLMVLNSFTKNNDRSSIYNVDRGKYTIGGEV